MQLIVLSIHLVVCLALIGLVLLQRSEGGALGMGGGNSGALMSGRGAADALAKMTQVAGFFFLVTSLSLTVLSGSASSNGRSVFDLIPRVEQTAPAPRPAPSSPPAAPDPTQSSAPQAAQTQLAAAILPGPAPASAATPSVVPPSTTAGAHAAPIQVRPAPATATPLQTVSASRTQPPAAGTTQRSTSVTTQRAATAPAAHGLVLPSSAGSQALAAGQTAPESSDGVQPVRRQRAGPDQ